MQILNRQYGAKYIQNTLAKKAKLVDFCNRQFEGEAKLGKTVRILNAPSPTISDYNQETGLSTPETFAGTYTDLTIDQAKAFNFMIGDIDKAQTINGVVESILEEKSSKMLEMREKFIGSLAAGATNVSASTLINTKALAKSAIDAGLLFLREHDVALDDNVHIELTPYIYQLFRDYIIDLKTDNVDLINRGIVGMYDGATVVMSNCLYNDKTDDYCMIRTGKAIAFASSIDKLEAYRPEKFFADAIKGLDVYGGKIVRQDELYVIKTHRTASSGGST